MSTIICGETIKDILQNIPMTSDGDSYMSDV
jgi:hypothetical protein